MQKACYPDERNAKGHRKGVVTIGNRAKRPPDKTQEVQENRLISMAMDVAEQQMRNGTCSSQVLTHFLKLGALKEQLEKEKLEKEIELLRAKTDAIQAAKERDEMFGKVIKAIAAYTGHDEYSEEEFANLYEDSDLYGTDYLTDD